MAHLSSTYTAHPNISPTRVVKKSAKRKEPKIDTEGKGWRKSLPPLRGGDGERGGDVSPSGGRRRRLVPRLRHPRGPPGRRLRRLPVGRLRLLLPPKVRPGAPPAYRSSCFRLFWRYRFRGLDAKHGASSLAVDD